MLASEELPPPPPTTTVEGDERFPMCFAFDFIAGEPATHERFLRPPVTFRAEHLTSNVREPGVATLNQLYSGMFVCLLGDGLDLCCVVGPEGSGSPAEDGILGTGVKFPWVHPGTDICLRVTYSGRVPPGHFQGLPYRVVVTLTGSTTL